MRKFSKLLVVSLLLMSLCFSFFGCGSSTKKETKSIEVLKVEDTITSLSNLPMDTYDDLIKARKQIEDAEKAFNELSASDQAQVSNKNVLDSEHARLYENEYVFAAQAIQFMNINSDYTVATNVEIWDNVGASDFFSYVDYVIELGQIGYSGLVSKYGKGDADILFWAAGYALDYEYFKSHFDNFTSSKISEIQSESETYVLCASNVLDAQETLEEFINIMKKDYSSAYGNEMSALWTWWVESSLYADHALNPSGNLNSYISEANQYTSNISRYQKLAGY